MRFATEIKQWSNYYIIVGKFYLWLVILASFKVGWKKSGYVGILEFKLKVYIMNTVAFFYTLET